MVALERQETVTGIFAKEKADKKPALGRVMWTSQDYWMVPGTGVEPVQPKAERF